MSRGGRRWQAFSQAVLAEDGSERCWLCGHVECLKGCCRRANTVDHVVAFAHRPELEFERSNVRPAHRCCNCSKGDRPAELRDEHTQQWF